MRDTKEKILCTALTLFAQDGYEAVSVSAIAGALGVTKGALYRHYASKRAVFDAILKRMEDTDARQASAHRLPTAPLPEMEGAYRSAELRDLAAFCRSQFRYWTQDPFAAAFRRMLTIEQHRSEELRQLHRQYLTAGPMKYTADLLSAQGVPEPEEAAAALCGTMFLLYGVYDSDPDKAAVTALLERSLQRLERQWTDRA